MLTRITLILLFQAVLLFPQGITDNNRYMLAQSYEQAGELEKAKTIYEDLYGRNPGNSLYFNSLNKVYTQLKDYASSIKMLEGKIKEMPQDVNLYGMLGSVYYMMDDEKKAFEVWDEALNAGRGNDMNCRVIANYAIERRAFNKAIDYLKKGKERAADKTIFSFDLANLYTLTMQYGNAAAEYSDIITAHPEQYRMVEARILSYTNKPEALEGTIEVFENYKSKEPEFRQLLASLYIQKKDFNKAYELFLQMDDEDGMHGSGLFNFAQVAYNEKEYKIASDVFSKIIEKYPSAPFIPSVKLGYAKTLEQSVLQDNSLNSQSWKPYYKNEPLNSGTLQKAIDVYNEVLSLYPNTDAAYEVYLRTGALKTEYEKNYKEGEESFNKLLAKAPFSRFANEALFQLGLIHTKEGKLDKAVEDYTKIVNNTSAREEEKYNAKYRLALIHFYKGDFPAAKEAVEGLSNNLKDNAANDALQLSLLLNTALNDSAKLVVFAQGEFLAEQEDFKAALEKYKEASAAQGFMLQNLAQLRTAEMLTALNNYTEAEAILQNISNGEKINIYADKALFLLGNIYQFALNDYPRAVEVYGQLLAKYPSSLYLDDAREEIIKLKNKLS